MKQFAFHGTKTPEGKQKGAEGEECREVESEDRKHKAVWE